MQVLPPKPEQVLPNEFQDKIYDDPPQLIWEYARDDGWARLGVTDETKAFADRGLIRFIGPHHFTSRHLFGRDLYWLRVRWQGGEFPIFPLGRRLRLNTIWAAQTTTIENEPLGSGNGNPNQTLQTMRQPVQPGQRLEIREMELSDTELEQLQADEAVTIVRDNAGNIDEIWVQWHEVRDFYTSGPTDRHYTLDHMTGRVQFGAGTRGMLPPVGSNNIRLAQYRTGGGAAGNRATETIVQLKSTIPYVASVVNYEPAAGGAAPESLASVKRYGPRTLRHRGRAVTAQDIEDLAFAASANVARVRAIPPRFRPLDLWLEPGAAGPDMAQHQDVEEAGRVGLIIVPRSDLPQPVPGPELLDRVRASLLSQIDSTANLWISGPDWMEVKVVATIVPTSLQAADFVGERTITALKQFLHPLTGGFEGKGWQFGRRPYRSDVYTLIEDVEGVDHVRDLAVIETPEASELPPDQFLIYSGQHEVIVVLDEL
jgi:predicted phage baseplate assembly protein